VRWTDVVALAVRGAARRFSRTALTILAVALAAALLTALVVIADTARTRVIGQLTKGGPLATIRVEGSSLDDRDIRLLERLPDVATVLPVVVAQEVVVPPDPPVYGEHVPAHERPKAPPDPYVDGVIGLDVSRIERFPVTLLAGRLPTSESTTEAAVTEDYLGRIGLNRSDPVLVLGTEIEMGAPRLLGSDLRDGVWVRWTRATVVGVVAQEAASGEIVVPIRQALAAQAFERLAPGESIPHVSLPADGSVSATSLSVTRSAPVPSLPVTRSAPVSSAGRSYGAFLVEARSLDRVGETLDEINALGYTTSAPENLIATVQRYLHVVEIVLTAIGLIALVIAALGIANALFAAIRERRREIGVLKAIGARDRDIRRVFLTEAVLVGLVGGLLGTLAGRAIAGVVSAAVNSYLIGQGLLGVRLVAPAGILAAAVGGSVAVALAAGVIPATRAARLPARLAMGEE
jgi:hypothetical protein